MSKLGRQIIQSVDVKMAKQRCRNDSIKRVESLREKDA
jgi:hypothetical protein